MLQLLERFVTAFEKIAEVLSSAPVVTATIPEEVVTDDRDAIKAKLDKFGAIYSAKARTETLKALLDQYETAAAAAAEQKQSAAPAEKTAPVETVPDFGPEPEKPPMATLETVRDALKSHAIKYGKESAQKILKDAGQGATKLSDVIPALYPAIIQACNATEMSEAA